MVLLINLPSVPVCTLFKLPLLPKRRSLISVRHLRSKVLDLRSKVLDDLSKVLDALSKVLDDLSSADWYPFCRFWLSNVI